MAYLSYFPLLSRLQCAEFNRLQCAEFKHSVQGTPLNLIGVCGTVCSLK